MTTALPALAGAPSGAAGSAGGPLDMAALSLRLLELRVTILANNPPLSTSRPVVQTLRLPLSKGLPLERVDWNRKWNRTTNECGIGLSSG